MFDVANQLIEERLLAKWGTMTAIAWDNVEYVPTRGVDFIRTRITQVESEMIAGDGVTWLTREHGLLTVQVFTKKNEGSSKHATRASQVVPIFRGYTIDRLFMGAPRITIVGENEEFFQSNVLCPFYYDNCSTLEA